MTDRWIILRTAGPRTLPLARSLAAAGFDAWTPVFIERRRSARSKVVREVETAGMPTFVFVDERHHTELVRFLLPNRINPHPAYSFMRHCGDVVTVRDGQLSKVREREADSQRRAAARAAGDRKRQKLHGEPFAKGERIRMGAGMFGGIDAVVTASNGRHTMVLFGTHLEVEIETLQLRRDIVDEGSQPEPGDAPPTGA